MELKDRINEAMTAAKLSPADLARATKSTNAAINFWLKGKTKSLKAEKAAMIETATGYCAQWVISGKGRKLLADEEIEQNQPLALIGSAQAATNNIATLGACMEFLAGYMVRMEPGDRAEALRMMNRLATEPDAHAKVAKSIEGMVSEAFARQTQKVA